MSHVLFQKRWLSSSWLVLLFAGVLGCPSPHGAVVRQDGGTQLDEDAGAVVDADAAALPVCLDAVTEHPEVAVYEIGLGELGKQGVAVSESLVGAVTELGSGSLPDGTSRDGLGSLPEANLRWIRVAADGGREWVVASRGLAWGFSVTKGTAVSVNYFEDSVDFWKPERTALSLEVGGTRAFYFGRDADPSGLELLGEWSVEQGRLICEVQEECGHYALYDARVSIEGHSETLGTREQSRFGDYDVYHLRTAHQLWANPKCFDWSVRDTVLSVAHRGDLFEAPGTGCKATALSTLPGVHIDIDDSNCSYTLAQAAAGLTFHYQVVVDQDVEGVTVQKQDSGGCQAAHASGLYLGERVFGGNQVYCICDTGLCAPGTETPRTLQAATYEGTFTWDGRNWGGPSDTNNPKGEPFPAGRYAIEVRSSGTLSDATDFMLRGALTFTLK